MTGASRSPPRFRPSIPPLTSKPICCPSAIRSRNSAVVAADEAMAQAGFGRKDLAGPRTAVIIGSGIGGMNDHRQRALPLLRASPSRPEPLTRAAHHSEHGADDARHAIFLPWPDLRGRQRLRLGEPVDRARLADDPLRPRRQSDRRRRRGLRRQRRRSAPGKALRVLTPDLCRPFSKGRNGMTLGEGAAVFILETAGGGAGARPSAAVRTRRLRHHERRQGPRAAGCRRRVERHRPGAGRRRPCRRGTSITSMRTAPRRTPTTSPNPRRFCAVFGDELGRAVPVSSTKPIHGHALGAGGGLELAITISALREQIAPPTINFLDARPALSDRRRAQRRRASISIKAAMSNSFAFGGINAVLIVRALDHDG